MRGMRVIKTRTARRRIMRRLIARKVTDIAMKSMDGRRRFDQRLERSRGSFGATRIFV